MLATVVYRDPAASYTFSMAASRMALAAAGWASAYYLLSGNCHVDDARNAVCRDFLTSDCTDLVFLDADVSWKPDDLVTLLNFDADFVGGVYPYRRDNDVDMMPVRCLAGAVPENGLVEVDGLPTGFLRLKRHVIERMAAFAPKLRDTPTNPPMPVLFERDFLGEGRRSGDIRFAMRWREMGGKVHAALDLVLGHTGTMIHHDSMAAYMRRWGSETLSYMAKEIKAGRVSAELFDEARYAFKNPFTPPSSVLMTAALAARKADGDILEIGSGLSTIAMAAATEKKVWAVEHDPVWAAKLEQMAYQAGTRNIALVTAPIKDGWYDPKEMEGIPDHFALAFCDGPPRAVGSRMPFFERLAQTADIVIADDCDDPGYRAQVTSWCETHGRKLTMVGRAAFLEAA